MKETKLKVTFSLSDAQTKSGCKYDIASMKDALKRIKGHGCFNIKFKHITTECIDISKILN